MRRIFSLAMQIPGEPTSGLEPPTCSLRVSWSPSVCGRIIPTIPITYRGSKDTSCEPSVSEVRNLNSDRFYASGLRCSAWRQARSYARQLACLSSNRNTLETFSSRTLVWSRGEQRASPGEVLHALGLEAGEYLAGPVGDLARQTGEAGDVDAVGGGLGALLDAV